jgi:predicted GNAT family N-acyltransferase
MPQDSFMLTPVFRIIAADWMSDRQRLSAVRRAVFIGEQHVPEVLEWDEHDEPALHWLALDANEQAIACARLLPDGHIGRMAVLPQWRGRGVGQALLETALQAARERGLPVVKLSAQNRAVPFYARFGFQAVGPEYLEAGIAHVAMIKKL